MSTVVTVPVPVALIVPARNEPAIAQTVAALRRQTYPPTVILVVANNCSPGDGTAAAARAAGAEVLEIPNCPGLKAGAINAGLDHVDRYLPNRAAVMIVDADSVPGDEWIARAVPLLAGHGCVSGAFEAIRRPGLINLFQRTEYAQARARITQRRGRVAVLSGAASIFNLGLLRAIRNSRGRRHPLPAAGWVSLPGRPGDWFNTQSLTEDYEITLCAEAVGARPVSPPDLRVHTDTMRSVRELWRQRLRWQHGYMQDTARFPMGMTWRKWLVQGWVFGSALAVPLMGLLLGYAVATGTFTLQPAWLAVTPIFAAAEMWAARHAGPAAVALAGLVVPMWAYATFRNLVYYAAAARLLRHASHVWH